MRKLTLVVVLALLITSLFAGCGAEPAETEVPSNDTSTKEVPATKENRSKLQIAFVYNGAVGDDGWCDAHETARKNTQEALDDIIETSYIEPVTPGTEAEQVFSELGDKKYDVVVAATAAYESDVQKIAPMYPDTIYLVCSGTFKMENVESFWPDRTALWYAYGVMAGLMTETNKVGFTASNPIPMEISCQNAFLLGAQSVNPDTEQIVIYIGTYYDPAAERDAAYSLAEAGCDVLWNNTDTPSHVQVAQEKGLYAMSQYADQRDFGPDSYLGGEFLNWEAYYMEVFPKIYNGEFEAQIYFPNIQTGASKPQEYTKNVPEDVREKFEEVYGEMMVSDNLYEYCYSGPIYDTEGVLRCPEGEYLDTVAVNEEMDWMVAGTISSVR